MKLERLISIIFKLLNNEILSASSLADEFQVSPRTIYRDIEAICAAGIPVVSYQGTNGGFGIIKGYKFDKSLMGSYDILNLITVLSSLSNIFKDKEIEHTIDRLKLLDTNSNNKSLLVDLESHRTEPNSLMNLRKAIHKKKVIHFNYVSNKNEFTSREVEPIHLHYKFRNWYIYGYCRERQNYREFRLSRMMDVTLTQEKFLQNHEIKDEAFYSNRNLVGFEDVVIWVSPNSLAEALDQFQNSSKTINDDGSMTITISVYQPLQAGWLKSILLSFGSGAKIVKPMELQSILIDEAKKIIKVYEDI
ncbi:MULTISPECIES: helix-turn-helix transcriptional regulator [Bacillus]|uniref:helix-turn-helix transcriptional regulator n=1 Tax=Bacillus TaxID=1386 RepID=UPI0001A14934|nr:YafY family protein [Bacillus pseudomycoides]EEM07864.1 Transcriptional regulator [Bacillus pseudomycoides]EEM13767.1 Transcriptional regulator [Bacillus pseudomycoides DSM 12442]MED1594181.1 YafY family protein [Bacillus pseudomycoides]MED1623112.1 YafY family protein [Bacillus pseudomycoides]MED4714538.1 YafY family protein [Bacillus pseudomycoides]